MSLELLNVDHDIQQITPEEHLKKDGLNRNLVLLFWSPRNFFKHTKNTQSLVQYLRGDSLCLGSNLH